MFGSLEYIFILIPPMLLAITLHEYAHGLVADRLGDPTPRIMGRLTLNPIKHLDLVGTLVFIFTRMVGWAKPVPVNPLNLKNHERSMVWVAIAGPTANIILAILSSAFYKLFGSFYPLLTPFLSLPLMLMLQTSIAINIALALFNLIPVPPLDGGRILAGLLPQRYSRTIQWLETYGPFLLIILIVTNVVNSILSPILTYAIATLRG